MPKFTTKQDLLDAFQQLGCDTKQAESLAEEQLKSAIPHLETMSFLKIVSSFMCSLDEPERMRTLTARSEQELAGNESALAKRRMLLVGVDPLDIKIVARAAQFDLLHQLFGLMDNVSDYDGYPVDEFNLYAINESTNEPDVLIDGLHECVSYLEEWT